jgi:hypothetical protein
LSAALFLIARDFDWRLAQRANLEIQIGLLDEDIVSGAGAGDLRRSITQLRLA